MSNILDNNRPERDAASHRATGEDASQKPLQGVPGSLEVEIIIDPLVAITLTPEQITHAVRLAAAHRGFTRGEIGVRVTDDATIRQINREHLNHDDATDVISFGYAAQQSYLSGELVVSAELAEQIAAQAIPASAEGMAVDQWSAAAELLLYAVHGTLHLTGMDDHQREDREAMRQAEALVMKELGFGGIAKFGVDQWQHEGAGGSGSGSLDRPPSEVRLCTKKDDQEESR